jgi:DNA polymerase-3 subunit alpha
VISGGLDIADDRCQIIADELTPLEAARADAIRQVHVRVPLARVDRDGLERLRAILADSHGSCEGFLHLLRPDDTETILALPESIRVAATDDIVHAVEGLLGPGMVWFR